MDEPKKKGKRVYEVAKEYHISSEALISMLKSLDSDVKSHMSVVQEDMLAQIKRKFEEERESSRQEIQRKKVRAEERKHEAEAAVPQREVRDPKKAVRRSQKTPQGPGRTSVPRVEGAAVYPGAKDRTRRLKRARKKVVEQKVVEQTVRRTMAEIEGGVRPKRRRVRRQPGEEVSGDENIIRLSEFSSVAELAQHLEAKPAEVIGKCLDMGMVVSINQRLDMDTMMTVADEFGYQVEPLAEYGEDLLQEEEDEEGERVARAPVVTIMGHVDHGKTSLLDYVRKSNIIAGESGGITQHIGAYEVALKGGSICFLDTPGHEAFTAMRARGAQVTDIVVLVIAADDDVLPQTIEAIDHARAASVPIVVAVNKMDLPAADPDKIKRQLSDQGLLVEEWGGKTTCGTLSAKTGEGVDKLLELILLEAEMLELSANPKRRARGTIIEAQLNPGRGPMATVLVQDGTLEIGSSFVAGMWSGKARAVFDEREHQVESAGPSTPVQVVGLDGVPQAGDSLLVVADEREAREISQKRRQLKREREYRRVKKITLTEVYSRIKEGEMKELRLIVKGDVDGSVGALSDSLMQLSDEEVTVQVIHGGVGAISESDVLLASASDAIVIGFHVRPDPGAREMAEREHVDVRFYRVIYEAVEDVKAALAGLLPPEVVEHTLGLAQVRETFKVPRVGTVAGCFVQSGLVRRNASVRLVRDSVVVHEGLIFSLKRFKEDAREVAAGFECGVGLQDYDDVKVDDVLEVFEMIESEKTS